MNHPAEKPDSRTPVRAIPERGLVAPYLRPLAAGILLLYAGFLLLLAALHAGPWGSYAIRTWDVQDEQRFSSLFPGLILLVIVRLGSFLPVGWLMPYLWRNGSCRCFGLLVSASGLIIALPLAAATESLCMGLTRPVALGIAVTVDLFAYLFGVWMGVSWQRGWRSRGWLLLKVAIVMLLVVGSVTEGLLQRTPLSFESATITSGEKRRLIQLFRAHHPNLIPPGQTITLRLTEHDLDGLLAWGLSVGASSRKARISLSDGEATLSASALIPLPILERYLNLDLRCGFHKEPEGPAVQIEELRLGRITIPRSWLRLASRLATHRLCRDSRTKPIMDVITTVQINDGAIGVTYGHVMLTRAYGYDVMGLDPVDPGMLESARAQVGFLIDRVNPKIKPAHRLGLLLEFAFKLARGRSQAGDPVRENRAAIIALGVLLGHPRIAEFFGPVMPASLDNQTRDWFNHVTLRDREDWTKHFFVSAAITLLSTHAVSDAAGLLKEELDAGLGGSGFSFGDLTADRAGAMFASIAMRDEGSARRMQNRLANGFRVDEFFPPAADMPENMTAVEFQARYGSVGSAEYQHLLTEIDRRIAGCAAYR